MVSIKICFKNLSSYSNEIIDKQSQDGGLLITSQVPIKLWFEQFQDPTIADAVMDRILHRSYELEVHGRSYREKMYSTKE